jgi:hypothetical protein
VRFRGVRDIKVSDSRLGSAAEGRAILTRPDLGKQVRLPVRRLFCQIQRVVNRAGLRSHAARRAA